MEPNNIYAQIVDAYVVRQSWFARRKDTLVVVLGGFLQVAQMLAVYTAQAPAWVSLVLAVAIGLAQATITAATKGAITPSMGDRLARMAEEMKITRGKHTSIPDVIENIRRSEAAG